MSVDSVKVKINGTVSDLRYNPSSGRYETTLAAPVKSSYSQDGHFYNVEVTAKDTFGNVTTKDGNDSTLGRYLRLVVKEKIRPSIFLAYPSYYSTVTNKRPIIQWRVTDADSGINVSSIRLLIDYDEMNNENIIKSPITNGYDCRYTPFEDLKEGIHRLRLSVDDNDGNAAYAVDTSFYVDTLPPELVVTKPDRSYSTNASTIDVEGTVTDAGSSPTVTLSVLNSKGVVWEYKLRVATDGTFTANAVALTDGVNTLTFKAVDAYGHASSVVRRITVDSTPPVIQSVDIVPSEVDAGTGYKIVVFVTD